MALLEGVSAANIQERPTVVAINFSLEKLNRGGI